MMRPILIILCLLLTTLNSPTHAQDSDYPAAVPLVAPADAPIVNILLIGSATNNGAHNPGLTDTLMLVSLNTENGHVAVLSIPRDLYVYVPKFGMRKINQAYFLAERAQADSGIPILYATLRHNLGVEIDHYARVDFESLPAIIDAFGGVPISVDCAIEDWRLIDPELDPSEADHWAMFTLWNGLYHMDGETALWYMRSRRTSNDLDRNRRQQDVLRALWRHIQAEGLLQQLPMRWTQFQRLVDTDMTIQDALPLLPIVVDLSPAAIEYYRFTINQEVTQTYTPDEGRFIFAPIPDAVARLMQQVITPTTPTRLNHQLPTVAIYNGTGIRHFDVVAAHRLEREGFQTIIMGDETAPRHYNLVVDHTGTRRNNPVAIIQDILHITDAGVQQDPDPRRTVDYELYLGDVYPYQSCTYPVAQPTADTSE